MVDDLVRNVKNSAELSGNFRTVFLLWQSIDDEGRPKFKDFGLDRLPTSLLPWSVVVDIEDGGQSFRFRFWGTERQKLIGEELTGKTTLEISHPKMRRGNHDQYVTLYKNKQPMLCQTPIFTSYDRELQMTSLRLPFFDDAQNVSHIFSAIDPAEITEHHYAHFGTRRHPGI